MVLPLEASTNWPSGYVTFVLTDIEGSTRMLRRLGRGYDDVIGRHNALLREAWERDGICLLPGFLSQKDCGVYRQLCDSVLRQARAANPRLADSTNIAWLTQLRYWRDDRQGLMRLLELIAAPKAVGLIRSLTGEPPLFNNTQYFAEPVTKAWCGLWHRDCQFLAADEGAEQATMERLTGIHLHIALVADDSLSYLPGSHRRRDLPEERRIRRADDPDTRSNGTMPGAEVVRLGAGDAALFNAWGIHRGRYDPARPRRTHTWRTPRSWTSRAALATLGAAWGTARPTMAASSSLLGVSASSGRSGLRAGASAAALATLTGSTTTGIFVQDDSCTTCLARFSRHLVEQPCGFVNGTLTGRPANRSSSALRASGDFTVSSSM